MVMMRDPNWTGPGPGPMIDVPAGTAGTQQPNDVSSISDLYNTVGGRVTGSVQTYIDEIYAGAQSGKYSISDVQNALNIVNEQANQGITGAAALGVVPTAPGPVDLANEDPVAKQMRLDRENSAAIAGAAKLKNQNDARKTIASVLADYGLSGLSDYAYTEIIAKETVNINNPDAIIYALKEQPVYKERFKANEARKAKGLAELDPASYLALEDSYRTTMQSNGLPQGFYDNLSDFQTLIEGDVSPGELQSRVKDGFAAVAQADPTVKRQMQELYGISEGQLAAHFLDPTKAAPLLKQQATAANIAARGKEMAGIQLTALSAQDLVERGYTADQAATAFGKLGKLGELTQTLAGEKDITQSQQIGNAFGYDTQAAMDLEQRKRQRVGQFSGGGSFARTQGQTSGSISTSIGKAQ